MRKNAQGLSLSWGVVYFCRMQPEEFAEAVRARLQATELSSDSAAVSHEFPQDAIRRALEGHISRLDRAAEICDALELEFYIGPSHVGPGGSPERLARWQPLVSDSEAGVFVTPWPVPVGDSVEGSSPYGCAWFGADFLA